MGRVAKPENLERAPDTNTILAISLVLHSYRPGVIPINNRSHCLMLNSLLRGGSLEHCLYQGFHTLPGQTPNCCRLVILEN